VDECKPLPRSRSLSVPRLPPKTRGLRSFTFQLNVSAFCEEGCVEGMSTRMPTRLQEGRVRDVQGVFVYQKRLRLS